MARVSKPQQRKELHGIELDAFNSHFASVSTTDARVTDECNEVISQASRLANANDVVLTVAHFSTQARGSDGIPQLVIARALPLLLMPPLQMGFFRNPGENLC